MRKFVAEAAVLGAGLLIGCSTEPKTPAVADNVRASLKQAGLKDVSVKQDRDKGVVTLSGTVPADAEKTQAQQLAQAAAGNEVVANEIAVVPPNDSSTTKTVYSDVDKGIDNNLDAALLSGGFRSGIHHSVKNGDDPDGQRGYRKPAPAGSDHRAERAEYAAGGQ